MRAWRSRLAVPGPDAGARATLRWVRRLEIATGLGALALALALWGDGWVPWLLLGAGILGLSPWPGAAAILRKAERTPEILVTYPQRGRQRARRALALLLPAYTAAGAVVGYLAGGWPAALVTGALVGAGGALGAWWSLRRLKA